MDILTLQEPSHDGWLGLGLHSYWQDQKILKHNSDRELDWINVRKRNLIQCTKILVSKPM